MTKSARTLVLVTMAALALPVAAQAYIGPGVGAGAIAAVLGVIGSIFLAIFAVLYYPIKRALKRRRKPAGDAVQGDTPAAGPQAGE